MKKDNIIKLLMTGLLYTSIINGWEIKQLAFNELELIKKKKNINDKLNLVSIIDNLLLNPYNENELKKYDDNDEIQMELII